MKVQIYMGGFKTVEKSGVGRALLHQKEMLRQAHMETTDNWEKDAQVIHINTVFPNSVFAALKAKMMGKAVVYYGHSTMEDVRNSFKGSNLLAPLFKKWIKFCYNFGDVVVTPTEYSKSVLDSYNLKKPVVNLSNGVDTEFFNFDETRRKNFRRKYSLDDKTPVVISVGHYIKRKGIIEFVQLAQSMPDVMFFWFGYTNLNIVPQNVREAIENAPSNLVFPGYAKREELRDAYCGADVFAFMSFEETEGIVVLEALACKISSVVRDIPVYKNWLHGGVNVYKAKTNEEFKEKIEGILKGSLPNLTEKGFEVARDRSMAQMGLKLRNIYDTYGLLKEKETGTSKKHVKV